MKYAVLSILSVLLAAPPSAVDRATQELEKPQKPRLEVDLGRYGYKAEDKFAYLGYTGDDTLVFVWLTYRESYWRTNVHQVPAVAHLVSIDATSGAALGSATWSVFPYPMRAFALTGGRSMLCSGSTLRVYSVKGAVDHERALAGRGLCAAVGGWSGYAISPGRSRMLIAGSEHEHRALQELNAGTLEVSEAAREDSRATFVSETMLASCCSASGGFSVRAPDGQWRNVEPTRKLETATHGNESATFLNEDVIVIPSLRQISVVSLTGDVLSQANLESEKEEFGRFVTAQRVPRFAVMKTRLSGPNAPSLDLYPGYEDERVAVYDIVSAEPVFEISAPGVNRWLLNPWFAAGHRNEFTLSPDGRELAIANGARLRIYELPPAVIH
jgi:hypothetical protein